MAEQVLRTRRRKAADHPERYPTCGCGRPDIDAREIVQQDGCFGHVRRRAGERRV